MILWGPSRPDLLRPETLADILRETAGHCPAAHALEDGDEIVTYSALLDRADRIARALSANGCGPGTCVGLWLPRGQALIVAQAGITLAGAAWLPFDAAVPIDRLVDCMHGVYRPERTCFVVTDALGAQRLRDHDLKWPLVPLLISELEKSSVHAPLRPASRADTAYIIATSGSTGEPKSIAITQQSICHFLRSENEVLGICSTDRVYQGFSLAFDMSLEEIWISFLVGATLWIAPTTTVTDPDAVEAALGDHGITVLHAVPTLLSLVEHLPATLRLLNVGGEACSTALAERITGKSYRVFNTYGPTEITVTATVAELKPGQGVTIGKPLPNYGIGICDPEHRFLPGGETGEIVVFGPGLSPGYVGHEELTRARFVEIDGQRAYLTGDIGFFDAVGNICCQGRLDNQVKLRGFRIELDEISAALADQPGIAAAAVVVRPLQGSDAVVAFAVASRSAVDGHRLRSALTARLPTYMLPSQIEFLDRLPRLSSGKVDANALRSLPLSSAPSGDSSPAANVHEESLWLVLADLFPGKRLESHVDFFSDLGGHSLLAARLVTRLRHIPRYSSIGVQQIYSSSTLGAIAATMAALSHAAPAAIKATHVSAPLSRRFLCGLAQTACLPGLILLNMTQWLTPFFAYHWMTGDPGDSELQAIAAALCTYILCLALSFPVGAILRRILVGRLRAGCYPLWGVTYFRWWLGARLSEIPAVYLIAGSPWKSLYLRLLGAKVGRHCIINSGTFAVPELVSIGARVCLGTFVTIENARVAGGQLIIGAVTIGDDATVDSYAVLENDTAVGQAATLGAQSALADGWRIPDGETWAGAPACRSTAAPTLPARPQSLGRLSEGLRVAGFAVGSAVVATLFYIPVFPSFVFIDFIDTRWLDLFESDFSWWESLPIFFLLAMPAAVVLIGITILMAGLLSRCLPQQKEGRYSLTSLDFFWKWHRSVILDTSLQVVHGLYASVYVAAWLRLLGAKVGRDAEISTVEGIVPELLELGDESFIADGAMLGDEEQRGGWMTLKHTRIGNRSFIGNGAYVADGTIFPEDVLLGVQSSAPTNEQMESGQTWMGAPPMLLPARETIPPQDPSLTFRPSRARRVARGLIEVWRMIVPPAFVIAIGYVTVYETFSYLEESDGIGFMVALTCAGLIYAGLAFAFVFVSKWFLIGRYRPRLAPMWTLFVWTSEAVTILHESLAVPALLDFLRGTPMLPWAFRSLGVTIGHGVWLNTTDLTEFDCVEIGDEAELNALSGPQTHLFEDRVMRIGRVTIGRRATLGVRTTVLYDGSVGDECRLGPLTLVSKGEHIPCGTCWEGTPATPWCCQARSPWPPAA